MTGCFGNVRQYYAFTQMECSHTKIHEALDRWQEAHWHLHQIEAHFHYPDSFRYSFNAFIRALKEVPQILTMELQNHVNLGGFQKIVSDLREDRLISVLHKQRDFIVHKGNLEFLSSGTVGVTEGRKIQKMGRKFLVYPHESSDEAYERYKAYCRQDSFFRRAFGPDCDSWPFIQREWKLKEFGEMDLLEVAVEGWRRTGQALSAILKILGVDELDLSLSCRHDPYAVRTKEYSQEDFVSSVGPTSNA